jgi:hypothetical protein
MAVKTLNEAIEAISVLAQGQGELETVVKAQGELLRAMDARIKLLTALVDSDHETLIKNGLAKPRPAEEDPIVN